MDTKVGIKGISSSIEPHIPAILQHRPSSIGLATSQCYSCVKKGDKTNPANYRPVSLTCIVCKYLEHIIFSQIMNQLDRHNILVKFQHGFRANYSCVTHLLNTGPTGVYLLDFFCSGIQFNLLLSPYPCFISLLYLDLYVLGDDALIS